MAKEIESEFGLGQEFVPEELGEGGVDSSQDGEEMSFEGLNGPFSGVTAVDVRRHKVVGAVPVLLNDTTVFRTGFVVQHLGGDGVPERFETVHDGVVGGDAVLVFTSLEGGLEDGVGIAVVGNHDVLVAAAGADREPAGVVGVELFDGLHTDVDFARRGGRRCWRRGRCRREWLGLGGANALARL